MKPGNAIEVHNITKKFKVYVDRGRTLKELTLFSKRRKYEQRVVLDDISFEVKKGEAVGLIGHNGCGKSTTLKLLTRIMYPDSGTIEMQGRVSSLIELGAGFHPDMSGRQNIYTNASIFGLTRKEIDARVDKIIEFSELEAFIDNPVRTYSSGMYMRLAFAVAINVDAEILLIDEILAVGDANFQIKCFNKLQEIKNNGTTIVIVSHSLGQIEQICDKSIWINNGKVKLEGKPRDVHFEYLNYMAQNRENKKVKKEGSIDTNNENLNADTAMKLNKKRWGNAKVQITKIWLTNQDNERRNIFITGDYMRIHVEYQANIQIEKPVIGVGFWTLSGQRFYGSNTQMDNVMDIGMEAGEKGYFIYDIEKIPFLTGEYQLEVAIEDLLTCEQLDYWLDALRFQVNSATREIGISKVEHKWIFEKIKEGAEDDGQHNINDN